MNSYHIAVLFGGDNAERDVSIASAAQVIQALQSRGHRVTAVDTCKGILAEAELAHLLKHGVAPEPPSVETLSQLRNDTALLSNPQTWKGIDVAFLSLHGGAGENGSIQALLEMAGVAYTGSGVLGSSAAMDKDMTKRLCVYAGVPTAKWLMAPASVDEVKETIGFPCIVKPNGQGSTVGLTLVREESQYQQAVQTAFQHDSQVMIEQFIAGREVTVGVLEDKALAVGEIVLTKSEIFDYESKYQSGAVKEVFPADLPADVTSKVQEYAVMIHRALKLRGYSRADFRLTPKNELYCLEVNTLPGMTATSLLPQSAGALGMSFAELCETICRLAIASHKKN